MYAAFQAPPLLRNGHFLKDPQSFTMPDIKIIYCGNIEPGWVPLIYMATLMAELAGTQVDFACNRPSLLNALTCAVSSRRRNSSKPDLFIIASGPNKLRVVASINGWQKDYNRCFAWIVDSFWTERIPIMNYTGIFDRLFIMSGNDIAEYEARTSVKTHFVGWGTDSLRLGSGQVDRPVDLVRFGRQPASWKDDESNFSYLRDRGVVYQGRPPFSDDLLEGYKLLFEHLKRSKFALAFSNLASPANYTHPTKEYITARWTDAVSCGCVMAGISPKSDFAHKAYFSPEMLLELPSNDRNETVDFLASAVSEWIPERAAINYCLALRSLDWRWRFKEIADIIGADWPLLNAEIEAIQNLVKNGNCSSVSRAAVK